jgi:hypothetical protein
MHWISFECQAHVHSRTYTPTDIDESLVSMLSCISNIDNIRTKKKRQNNNRRKTKSLHCPQLDQHDADGLAGHKDWRTAQTIIRTYKRPFILTFLHFYILYIGPVFTENFNDFKIFIFVLSLITCIGDHGSKYRYRHITSIRQVVYVHGSVVVKLVLKNI